MKLGNKGWMPRINLNNRRISDRLAVNGNMATDLWKEYASLLSLKMEIEHTSFILEEGLHCQNI